MERREPGYVAVMVEVELAAVRVDVRTGTPVLLLQEHTGDRRTLPIFIGPPEATAIAFAIQGVPTERPMTHDLMRDLLETLGATVERVVVTELVDTTYVAELHLSNAGRPVVVSARPSDAVALAVRVDAPLFVADELLDAEGVVLDLEEEAGGEEPSSGELVAEFQRFLDTVRPEDFGG